MYASLTYRRAEREQTWCSFLQIGTPLRWDNSTFQSHWLLKACISPRHSARQEISDPDPFSSVYFKYQDRDKILRIAAKTSKEKGKLITFNGNAVIFFPDLSANPVKHRKEYNHLKKELHAKKLQFSDFESRPTKWREEVIQITQSSGIFSPRLPGRRLVPRLTGDYRCSTTAPLVLRGERFLHILSTSYLVILM